jgi:sec-independent protein translocase protein TatC
MSVPSDSSFTETPAAGPAAGDGESIDDSRMTLGEHLGELRTRLIRATAAFAIAVIVLYVYRGPALQFILIPYGQAAEWLDTDLSKVFLDKVVEDPELHWDDYFFPPELEIPREDAGFDKAKFIESHADELRVAKELRFPKQPQAINAAGPFITKLKIAVLLAVFVAGPIFLWEMWMFIAAGLYKAERRIVYSFFPVTLLLFLTGVAFGFYYMVPNAIYFLQADGIGTDGIRRDMELGDYMQFLRGLSLALGVVFQLPVAQVVLSRTGLVNPKLYAKYRGHMAIAALVIAMFLTPPDPFTQLLLAGPAIVLWEIGYWVSRMFWTPPPEIIPEDELTESGAAT